MFQPQRLLHLARSLFPRWSFFDRVSYDLDFEVEPRGQDAFKRISFTTPRAPFGFFTNSNLNLALAQQSLVQEFVQDLIANAESIEEQTSYKMVASLAQHYAEGDEFQFKLTARLSGKVIAMYASTWLAKPQGQR